MRTEQLFFTLLLLAFFGNFSTAFAAGSNSESLNKAGTTYNDTRVSALTLDTSPAVQVGEAADFDEFPNLHPLVVHFPIVLLLLAVVLQLIQLFTMTRTMDWVIWLTIGFGFIGAFVAANFVHPDTEGLTATAKGVLEQHDKHAMWAMWSSAAAAVLKVVSLFFYKRVRWFEIVVFLVMAFAGYSVAWAGHYGSQLVYIEGVGPQGQFMGEEHEGHEH